jgi:predicted nucleotidyltransferase
VTATARFPTLLHQQVSELIGDFFAAQAHVDTALLVNSCARGQAVPDSDLDVAVLVKSSTSGEQLRELERLWGEFAGAQSLIQQFRRAGRFLQVHLDVFDGRITPSVWDDGGGPDSFEVEIGNRLAVSLPLREPGPRFRELQAEWLPYYPEDLRLRPRPGLHSVPAGSRLTLSGVDRLYKAHQELLQALFVSYNKWIGEQVAGWLASPDLYRELPRSFPFATLKATDALRNLLNIWVQP